MERLNELFVEVFPANDGSGMDFSPSLPARDVAPAANVDLNLYLNFSPQAAYKNADPEIQREKEKAHETQTQQIVELIKSHLGPMEQARAACGKRWRQAKYRVAVLGRTRAALAPIATALREARIPFRALDLESLKDRPEVLDALAMARALLNPQDRVAWLGVLRAPWCGLSLEDLHVLTSADDANLLARPVPDLIARALASAQRAWARGGNARGECDGRWACRTRRLACGNARNLARTNLAPAGRGGLR